MDSSKVTEMIAKAAAAEKPDDAMKFAQAALNAAHALQVLKEVHK
jgi:hypothetical protein